MDRPLSLVFQIRYFAVKCQERVIELGHFLRLAERRSGR